MKSSRAQLVWFEELKKMKNANQIRKDERDQLEAITEREAPGPGEIRPAIGTSRARRHSGEESACRTRQRSSDVPVPAAE